MPRPVSVNAVVADYMAKYDHNRNGVIDLKRPDGFVNRLKNPDERVRSKTSASSFNDELTISTTVYSIDRLLYAADKNADGQVTREEMETAVKEYDKDKDGQMGFRGFWGWLTRKPRQEGDEFRRELGERTTNYGSITI
ncbi:MAG: hypothetical protein ACLGIN_06950 [Candidatus Sericytochromatia bacterium]